VAWQPHSIPLTSVPQREITTAAPSSCLGTGWEISELEGEKGHQRRERMRKVALQKAR